MSESDARWLRRQCVLFVVGSLCFAAATAPGVATRIGAATADATCFVGSWFFTAAAAIQWRRTPRGERADWWSAAVQSAGTVAFNLSTGAAVWAHQVDAERELVWTPDAAGSAAFLVSAALGLAAVAGGTARDRAAGGVNAAGCVAFGMSASAAYVSPAGVTADAWAASLGTFVGAACFAVASAASLPARR